MLRHAKFWLNFEPLVKIRNVSNLVTCYHEKKKKQINPTKQSSVGKDEKLKSQKN